MALTTNLAELLGLYIALVGVVMIVKPQAIRELMTAIVAQQALCSLSGRFGGSSDRQAHKETIRRH